MDIWFLRHGRSLADDEEKMEGRYDSPLTDVGRRQARELAERWAQAGHRFDRIVCSTLRRASETAEIVGAALDCAVERSPDWMERDNGPIAGLPYEEARARYPIPDFVGPFHRIAGGCESASELQGRAVRALQALVDIGSGRHLVVSHGGILNAAMRCLVGAAPSSGDSFGFGDTGHVETTYEPGRHRWTIVRFEPGV